MRPISVVLPLALLLAPLTAMAEPDPRTVPLAEEHPLYLDTQAPIEERMAGLVSRLTLEEKAQGLNHNGKDIRRIGLRGDKWNQCLNGVQWSEPTTLLPICTGLAATWNPAFIQNEAARVLSDEARGIYYNGWRRDPNAPGQHKGLIYRAPVINIERNPYWGRATGGDNSKQIAAGELVDSTNIALLITGNFKVATASSRDEPLKAAGDVLKSITAGATKPAVVFFFQDHLRRNALIKDGTLAQESKLFADASGGAPLFGIDDSGEIGHDAPTAVPVGGAMRTLAAAIIPR